MMNLEPRQLASGHYMQGIQLQLDDFAAVFSRLQELLLLPRAMRWLGEPSFELAAQSRLQNGGIQLHRYLNLRLRVDASAKEVLRDGLGRAAADLQGWLRSIGVNCAVVRGDDDSLFSQMPDGGYGFIAKSAHRAGNAYEKVVLPLDRDCGVELKAVRTALCRCPGCGITLHLTPDTWRRAEKDQIERFGRGSGMPEDGWKELLSGDIAAFVCALWGSGSEMVLDTIVNSHAGGLARAADLRDERGIATLLACDPWTLNARLSGRSRFKGVLSMAEMQRLFRFDELKIDFKPAVSAPAPAEAVMDEIRRMLDQQRRQTEESFNKALSETEGRFAERVSRSEAETRSVLRSEMGSAIERSKQEILGEIRKQTGALSRMMEEVGLDVQELKHKQDKLQDLMENQLLLTDEQLGDFVQQLESMTGERDSLRRELLDHTVLGAEKPLSKKLLGMMGVADEQQLLDGGMSEKQLTILRIAMACLEDKPIFNGGDKYSDPTDYHAYTIHLGFLYEQLMRDHYHDSLYLPYFHYCMPRGCVAPDLNHTDLYCYDRGPEKLYGYNSRDWSDRVMAENFSRHVEMFGTKKPSEYWNSMINRMRLVRRARNLMHNTSIDTEQAYNYVNVMVRNGQVYPCLIWMILNAGRAEAAFPNDKD